MNAIDLERQSVFVRLAYEKLIVRADEYIAQAKNPERLRYRLFLAGCHIERQGYDGTWYTEKVIRL